MGAAHTTDDNTSGQASGNVDTPTNVVDDTTHVTDSQGGALGDIHVGANPKGVQLLGHLPQDQAGPCTEHDSAATLTTNDTSTTGQASQSVLVCVGEDLQATEDAEPSFDRTYTWADLQAGKTCSPSRTAARSTTPSRSTRPASRTASTRSVRGQTTMTNPSQWGDPITLTGVTDAQDNGGTCSIA